MALVNRHPPRERSSQTVLDTPSVEKILLTDRITSVLPVLHCGFHSPLLVSLMLSETETVVEQDEHPASHVPNLKRACPLS